MRAFLRELLDPNGKISFMRFMGIPVIIIGLFAVVWGAVDSDDVSLYVGLSLVALGLTGKVTQKVVESRRTYPPYQQHRDTTFTGPEA